jgi:hypothetical protein
VAWRPRSVIAALVGAIGICAIILVWATAVGAAGSTPSQLVTLRRERSSVPWSGGESYRRSATLTSYEDVGYAPHPYLWEVAIQYSGCPITRAGAFRLTLFKDGRQYSRTMVDFRVADKAVYTWPGQTETTWEYRVAIPSRRGCASWSMGIVGN